MFKGPFRSNEFFVQGAILSRGATLFKDQIQEQSHSVQGAIQFCLKGIAILVKGQVCEGPKGQSRLRGDCV